MSSSVPTESSTTLTDNITLNDDSPFAYIAAGIRIGSIGGVAVNASDDALTVAVEGEVVGFDGIFADGTSNLFTIGAHGKAWGSIGGLVSHGSDATIFNAGTIFGGAFGIDLEGADHAQLHNSGTITGGRNGESEAGAVTLNALTSGETHRIDNSGLIQTQRAGGLAIAGIGNGVETIVNTGP